MTPPWIVPNGLACLGSVMIARLTREAEAGLAGIASLVMKPSFVALELIANIDPGATR